MPPYLNTAAKWFMCTLLLMKAIFSKQVCGGVRIHLLDDICRPLRIERLDDRLLNLWVNFFQGLRCGPLIERLKHGLPLVRSQVFYNVGYIGRVQFRQSDVGNLELHAPRGVGFDHVDKIPGNGFRGDALQERVQCAFRRYSTQQPPYCAPCAHIDRLHA